METKETNAHLDLMTTDETQHGTDNTLRVGCTNVT